MAIKTLKDIKTSTGKKSTRQKRIKINLSAGRIGFNQTARNIRDSGDLNNTVGRHLHQKKHDLPKIQTDWKKVLAYRIKLLKEEITECEKYCKEGINGSRRYVKKLKEKLEHFQNIYENYST